jgi:hypothetical protein
MIRWWKTLTILLVLVSQFGCKPLEQNSSLKVTVGPKPVQLLPVDLASCKSTDPLSEDIKKPSFEMTTFNFQWSGENPFRFSYIEINVKSPYLTGGNYQCLISGDELIRVVYPKHTGIDGNDNELYKNNCSLRCGGMSVNSSISNAIFIGTLTVVGTQVDSEGNGELVTSESEITINYVRPGSL